MNSRQGFNDSLELNSFDTFNLYNQCGPSHSLDGKNGRGGVYVYDWELKFCFCKQIAFMGKGEMYEFSFLAAKGGKYKGRRVKYNGKKGK